MYRKIKIFLLITCFSFLIIAANYETQTTRQENAPSGYGRLLSDAYKVIEKYELQKGTFSNIDYFKAQSNHVVNAYDPQPLTTDGLVNRIKNYRELKLDRVELVRFMIGYAKKVAPQDVAMMHAAFDCRVKNISFNRSMDQDCQQLFIKHKNNAAKIVENHLNTNGNNVVVSYDKQGTIEKRPFNAPLKIVTMMPVLEEGETYDEPVKIAIKPMPQKQIVHKVQNPALIKPHHNKNAVTQAIKNLPTKTPPKIISMMPVLDDVDKILPRSFVAKKNVKKDNNNPLVSLENLKKPQKIATKKPKNNISNKINKTVKKMLPEPVIVPTIGMDKQSNPFGEEINPFTQKAPQKIWKKASSQPAINQEPHIDLSETTGSIISKLPEKSVIKSPKTNDDAFFALSPRIAHPEITEEGTAVSGAMTLRKIVEKALDNNPERMIAVAQYYNSQSQIDIARAGYYPNVNLVLGTGREANNPFQQRNEQTNEYGYNYSNNANFRVEQMLFDGFITSETVAQRIKQAKSSRLNERRVSEEIILSAVQIYMQLRQFQKTVIAAEENLNALSDIEELVDMRVKLGDSNRTEKKYLEGRIASAEQNLINAQVGLGNAQSSLEFITGEKLNFDATLPDIKKDKKFANIENFLEHAFKNNTQISALNAEKEGAEHSLEATLGRYYPRLDFVVEAGHIQDRGGLTGNVRNGIVKLEMTIPIYDGGTRSALKRQRKAEIQEITAKQLAFQRRLKQDLKTSYQNRVGAVEQIATAVREIETQLGLEKLNKQQFKYGEKDIFITDLVESRERVFNAKLNKIRAESEYITSYYRIQQSLGEIFPEFCTKTCQVI